MDPEYQHARLFLEKKRKLVISRTLMRIFREEDAGPDFPVSADGRIEGGEKEFLTESEMRLHIYVESRAKALLISNARVAEWLSQTEALDKKSKSTCASCVCL